MRADNFIKGLETHIKGFSIDSIIQDLPEMLKTPANYLVDETEKEVFLIGALGVVSGMLPNIKGMYSGKWISPNLFVYVLAGYGGGKGGLDYARELGKQIHKAKRDEAKRLMLEYLKEMEVYKKALKEYNKSKKPGAEPPTKPENTRSAREAVALDQHAMWAEIEMPRVMVGRLDQHAPEGATQAHKLVVTDASALDEVCREQSPGRRLDTQPAFRAELAPARRQKRVR